MFSMAMARDNIHLFVKYFEKTGKSGLTVVGLEVLDPSFCLSRPTIRAHSSDTSSTVTCEVMAMSELTQSS